MIVRRARAERIERHANAAPTRASDLDEVGAVVGCKALRTRLANLRVRHEQHVAGGLDRIDVNGADLPDARRAKHRASNEWPM